MFDAARCSAYAARCGGIVTGSAPCPCRLGLLIVGRPDSMAARKPAKWLSNLGGIRPFLNRAITYLADLTNLGKLGKCRHTNKHIGNLEIITTSWK